ncbi:MAG: amidohydrolase family protein [Bacteroidia bacterium]|nr:amidohydrolase family protein [Bacteroidia bacterium]
MFKKVILSVCLLISSSIYSKIHAQNQPYVKLTNEQNMLFSVKNVKVIVSPGKSIDNATIVVRNGLIESVGSTVKIPEGCVVYDGSGLWLYPGWIDAYTEFNAPPKSDYFDRDEDKIQYENKNKQAYHWNEAVKSHFSVMDYFQTPLASFTEMRNTGFAIANVMPVDGIFRGTGSLISLSDGKAADNILIPETAMGISFRKGSSTQQYPSSLMGAISLVRQVFLSAEDLERAKEAFRKNPNQASPQTNLSLERIISHKDAKKGFIFESESWQHTLAADKLAGESRNTWIYKTSGDEYKRISAIKNTQSGFIIPLKFPKAYDIKSEGDGRKIALAQLKEWEQAPANPYLLAKEKIPFAFTMTGCTKATEFQEGLQKALQYGLSEQDALAALTVTPAQFLGIEKMTGTLEAGKWANMTLTNGNIFKPETKILTVFLSGKKYEINKLLPFDMRGEYHFKQAGTDFKVLIKGDSLQQNASVFAGKDTVALKSVFEASQNFMSLIFTTKDSLRYDFKGIWSKPAISGTLKDANGNGIPVMMSYTSAVKRDTTVRKPPLKPVVFSEISPVTFPNKAYGFTRLPEEETCVFKNVTLWTNTEKGILKNQDVLIAKGKIAAFGQNLKVPDEARVIDGTGKHLTNGIIDEHSHIGILQGVNEGTHSVTSEVRIGDVLDTEDINIYRQLSGGVTSAQLLHGSSNPIGGQSQIIKLRWGANPEGMKFAEAPPFIKFALGENVKQSNWGNNYTNRYPQTRMGVEQLIEDAFLAAKDYREEWEVWQKEGKSKHLIPPQRNLQLETLLEILDEKRYITCHSYVQSEIIMLMRLAEKTGFRINTFTHILEGYKIADKLKIHGAFASTFSDWWGYKVEVMEATPYNAAILAQNGVTVCINSDDAEMGRRLNQEAAKGIKYGNMTEEEAWKMVTLNPAKALHVDKYVGSIEKGKDADLVLWNDNPLSVYAKVLYTFIDGKCYFDSEKDKAMQQDIVKEKNRIIRKMIATGEPKADPATAKKEKILYHCDSEEGYD